MNFLITTSTLLSIFTTIVYNVNQSNFKLINTEKNGIELNYKDNNIHVYQYNHNNDIHDNLDYNDIKNKKKSILLYCKILNDSILLQTYSTYQLNMNYNNNQISCSDVDFIINNYSNSFHTHLKDYNAYKSLINYSINNEYVFKRIVVIDTIR